MYIKHKLNRKPKINRKLKSINRNILLIFLFFSITFCSDLEKNYNISGKWKAIYNSQEILFNFKKDNSCELRFYDNLSDKFNIVNGEYELDYSKRPIPLSIRHSPQLEHSLHTIIKFTGNNSIIMAEFSTKLKLRPLTFKSDKNINLNRINN